MPLRGTFIGREYHCEISEIIIAGSAYPNLLLTFVFLGNHGLTDHSVVLASCLTSLLSFLACVAYVWRVWYQTVLQDLQGILVHYNSVADTSL